MPVFSVPVRVTVANAAQVWSEVQQALQSTPEETPQSLDLDLSALVELDSSALALVLQTLRAARGQGCTVHLHKPPQRFIDLARLYGVGELLPGMA